MKFLLISSLLAILLSQADATGCKGGDTFNGGGDGCNLNSVTCTQDSCESMGGLWTDDCPDPDPKCDPLAPSKDDPKCTGPPEAIDRAGKKMYRRKVIASEKPADSAESGTFCHITLELCPGESSITHEIDAGFGDYYRLGATKEWQDYKGDRKYKYAGMNSPTGARSYSHVNPFNAENVQLIIKKEVGDPDEYDCTAGVDCLYGMSELACMIPVGADMLLSKNVDHFGTPDSTHYAYKPNFSREPGSGPYTINMIGQGVALTELNIGTLSELLNPFASDGSFATIKEVNYLWANSYWSSASWVFDGPDPDDLSRQMIAEGLKYGIRFNLMHAISREERPEATIYGRADVNTIGEAFHLTNTTDQDPNIKWFVVGSKGFKRSLYPQILEWGFNLEPCSPSAANKGYPYCGPNALYGWEEPGAAGLANRERSDLFKYYENLPMHDHAFALLDSEVDESIRSYDSSHSSDDHHSHSSHSSDHHSSHHSHSSDDTLTPDHAFVLLGPTGDNAIRDSGVWQGLYESWTGGVYNESTVQIHPTMNTPHDDEELEGLVMTTCGELYSTLQENDGWECKQPDCDPQIFYDNIVRGNTNIQDGRDANKQAESMIPALADYKIISVYLSIPPSAFGDWSTAAATHWGPERVYVAAEKPFGTSTEDANALYAQVTTDVPEDHLLLVDHWLSFFMVKNLPTFQGVVKECLGVDWSSKSFSKIIITEHEERGLEGRGGFFDGVGQVRDLIQSHLLQVTGLLLVDPMAEDRANAKLEIFDDLFMTTCSHGQYDDWLFEDNLGYHADFADATYSTMFLDMNMEDWADTSLEITTGKLMGTTLYTVQMYEAGGPGVLTFNVGAEEVGLANIEVSDWPSMTEQCTVTVPAPGYDDDKTMEMTSSVVDGTGMIVSYDTSSLYFPNPYAVMLSSMLTEDYSKGFVTFPEVNESWIVITADSPSICIDPPAADVLVYNPPDTCGNTPPKVCYTDDTVQDYYDVKFACTDENDITYKCVNFYQDKCDMQWNPPDCDDNDRRLATSGLRQLRG